MTIRHLAEARAVTKVKPWTCSKCRLPIKNGAGYVRVMDAATGGYPRKATETDLKLTAEAIARRQEQGLPAEGLDHIYALSDLEEQPDQIAFDAIHQACDPNPDSDEYWFAVERAKTLEAWCHWVHHLSSKCWMGTSDIARMIKFWFKNRGEDLHSQ